VSLRAVVAAVDRRWWVAVGMVAVLLAAVTVPLATKTYPGSPVAAPQPGPPALGECLKFPSTFPSRFGGCSTDDWGEVSAVLPDAAAAAPLPGGSSACSAPTNSYLGLDADGRFPGLRGRWTPQAQISTGLVAPTSGQQAVGQTWLACVISPMVTPNSRQGPVTARFQGSLRNAFGGGTAPPTMASCAENPGVAPASGQGWPIVCSAPHNLEVLALGEPTGSPSAADLALDCSAIARTLLGGTDPTAGGLTATAVRLFTDPQNSDTLTLSDPVESSVISQKFGTVDDTPIACVLAPTDPGRRLGGPLLGLGSKAVPWV
jgi:hypothetical protein